MLPVIPAPFWASAAPGSFRLRAGTRVAYADPALASMVERFCVEVARRTGVWCEPARATRNAIAGAPSIRVELARDPELDALPPADGISPAAAGGADERHALSIEGGGDGGSDRVVVRGVEPVGAARGLTTLLQLLATATPEDDGAIVLPAAHIVDAPRYAWRSQSLDLANRSFSVADLKRVIDLLVLYKVNVLHVRLDDDLTASELEELLAYAQARFVTVLAEFSTTEPAAGAWAARAVPVMVSPVDHAYFDVPDAATWSDPSADWSEHHDRLAAHRRLWEQDELTYFISSAIAPEAA
jgi:hypothetical protein